MNGEQALIEAWRLYDLESPIGACAMARVAIERDLAKIAQPNRRERWHVQRMASDLRLDGVISSSFESRIRDLYRALSSVVHGEPVTLGRAGEIVSQAESFCERLRERRPAYREWRRGAKAAKAAKS